MSTNQNVSKLTKEQLSNLLDETTAHSPGPTIGKRHIQVVLVFLVAFMVYIIRISFSVIIVAMTDPTANQNKNIPTYSWTDKSLVVSSFIWGYVMFQVPAGYLATKYGAKWFIAGSLLISSCLAVLIPTVAAVLGSKGVMGIRILQGISQGILFPSIHAFLSKWVPAAERSRLGTLPYLGGPVGTIVSMFLTGWMASSWQGWPMTIYVFSAVGLIVGCTFAYFGSSEPDTHPSITYDEIIYIKSDLTGSTKEKMDIPVPWMDIFTSLPFWALLMAQIGWSWSAWTLLLETPIYMSHVMKFDLKLNGVLSSLPYIAEAVSAVCYSIIADFLIVKNICSIGTTRKIMNFIGLILPSVALILLANCGSDDAYKTVTLLVLIGMADSATRSGYNVNQIDLAPNFAGILMGISNGTSAAVSALGPLMVQILVKDENDASQWHQIFYIAAAIGTLTFIFNVVFGSGSLQPWNEGSNNYRENQEKPCKA